MPSIRIDSIWGGETSSQYFVSKDQYLNSIGIDPDLPISDSVGDRLPSGAIRPSGYAAFDGSNVTANPYWFLTSPKTSLLYTYLNNGRFISYDTSFGSETLIGTPSGSTGNGAAYYNNYIYLATGTDISRYGPLSGASLSANFWTTTLSLTALVDTTYPSIRGSGVLPNHPMHVHIDNKLYIGDFKNGAGYIHFIKTSKTTNEGDTNDGSTYNALDLPFGYMPTDIESYGNDLVISAIQTSNSTFVQGKAALFFWDTISDSFYNYVPLPDPLCTALLNNNGILYVFSGSITTGTDVSNGYRISVYAGGQNVQQIYFSNVGSSPLAGAVDAFGDKVVWGTFDQIQSTTASAPEYYAVVKALRSKDKNLPSGAHGIINASAAATAADGVVTAVKAVQQSSFSNPKFIVGWRDSGAYGIDKSGTTYGTSVWRSQPINIGHRFVIRRLRFNLGAAVASNMTVTPKIFLDDFSSSNSSSLTVINNTNYSTSQRHIEMRPDISGENNFVLELRSTGTALLPIKFPIEIDFELIED